MAPHSSTHVRDIGYADTTTRCVCLYSTHGASHSRTIIGSYLLHQQCLARQIKLSPPAASFVKDTDIYNCSSWTTPPASTMFGPSNQAAPASCGSSTFAHHGRNTTDRSHVATSSSTPTADYWRDGCTLLRISTPWRSGWTLRRRLISKRGVKTTTPGITLSMILKSPQ